MPSKVESRREMAKRLAGSPALYDSVGLETPAGAKFLENLGHVGTGMLAGGGGANIVKALLAKGGPALVGLGEAGALFPKKIPKKVPESFDLGKLSKADMITDSERQYKLWENTAKQYYANNDFQGALRAKWGMLKNFGGN